MSKFFRVFAGSSALIASSAIADVPRSQPDQALQQLISQLGNYQSATYATDHGYIPGRACESHPALGAMGYHYFRPDLLGLTAPVNGRVNGTGTYTRVEPPAILLYTPDEHGVLKLVGIEILVFAAAWNASNHHPPMFHGREFNYMADDPNTARDEAHGFMPHYDLHIWFEHNPSGMYAQWNPSLSCAGAGAAH